MILRNTNLYPKSISHNGVLNKMLFQPIKDCENTTFKTSFMSIQENSVILIFKDFYSCFTMFYNDEEEHVLGNHDIDLIDQCFEEDLIENNLYTQKEIQHYHAQKTNKQKDTEYAIYLKLKQKYDPS